MLEIDQITACYGSLTALNNVSFSLTAGQRLGVFGHNGAGKTTLLRCISGVRPIGGGKVLFDRYETLINEFEVGDPLRYALEFTVRGGMAQLSFDTAGRVTLPEHLCELYGLTDVVTVVGLGDRFQIWSREAFQAQRAALSQTAREGLAAHRAQQRQQKLGAGA